jgi:adenosylhomocysteine nucleosidase
VRYGVIAPMPMELRAVVKAFGLAPGETGDLEGHIGTVGSSEVVAITSGMGTESATAATERLLAGAEIDHVVVVGVVGGMGPSVAVRDLIVPEKVTDWPDGREFHPTPLGEIAPSGWIVTSDQFGYPPDVAARMIDEGVVGVEMETAAIAAVCEAQGRPWTAFRGVSDRGDDETVEWDLIALANPDGTPNVAASLKYVARHPGRLPKLVAMGRDALAAARAAAEAAAAACSATH